MAYSLMVSFNLLLREYKAEAIRLMNIIQSTVNSLNFINDLNSLLRLSELGCSVTYESTLRTSNLIIRYDGHNMMHWVQEMNKEHVEEKRELVIALAKD
ncbi:hypothetical protein Tco_1446277, partial [Tanacetum coccineum]